MPSRLQFVFWLDAALLVLICLLECVPFTGLVLHEWLGTALPAFVTVHLLLSWPWIAASTRRLAAAKSGRTRVNYALNLCLFASMTALIFTGILISQEAIPAMLHRPPVDLQTAFAWDSIHDRLSDVVVILAGLHLAMNWDWAIAAGRKLLVRGRVGAS